MQAIARVLLKLTFKCWLNRWTIQNEYWLIMLHHVSQCSRYLSPPCMLEGPNFEMYTSHHKTPLSCWCWCKLWYHFRVRAKDGGWLHKCCTSISLYSCFSTKIPIIWPEDPAKSAGNVLTGSRLQRRSRCRSAPAVRCARARRWGWGREAARPWRCWRCRVWQRGCCGPPRGDEERSPSPSPAPRRAGDANNCGWL